ncbi:hypothetical protein ACZ91_38370, partial [Streptomyces regensis]
MLCRVRVAAGYGSGTVALPVNVEEKVLLATGVGEVFGAVDPGFDVVETFDSVIDALEVVLEAGLLEPASGTLFLANLLFEGFPFGLEFFAFLS